ncbi:ubiquitin-like protein Pup [Candidatus Poriferisodalis sp.]|uniref:ubiquitin-like protein Pup n=1 Tax=Candidatus Poriferisodalis sp. TaxID=3101277 RepID=UPI003AF5F090
MAERSQMRRSAPRETESTAPEDASAEGATELKAELDDLLDEIDDVLETNAEEFVKNYVQKGGE